MRFPCFLLLALAAAGGAAAPAEPGLAQEAARHRQWDRLLLESPGASGRPWPWAERLTGSAADEGLLAVLAAGSPDGPSTIGPEAARLAWRSARADGVLVRPDSLLAPTRESALPAALLAGEPMVAWAHSDHDAQRTAYVFCYDRLDRPVHAMFLPADFGFNGEVMVLNRGTGRASRQPADQPCLASLEARGFAYFEIVPVPTAGPIFFGDQGKYVSNGRQRIPAISRLPRGLSVSVVFAPGEKMVTVFGYAPVAPVVRARVGDAVLSAYSDVNGRFSVTVLPPLEGGGVQRSEVEIQLAPGSSRGRRPVFTPE